MTFLEFICESLLGPPISRRDDGQSTWPCPNCGHRRWHTMPHHPRYKDRFRCWACSFRGDEFDLLRYFYPREQFPDLKARLADLRSEYETRDQESTSEHPVEHPAEPTNPFLSGDRAGSQNPDRAIEVAWAGLNGSEIETLLAALEIAHQARVPLGPLAEYAWSFLVWCEESDARHVEICDDPDCDARICRAVRGLPPKEGR